MYKIAITGFKTKAQAEEFINWYEGQGEQDASYWFECRKAEGTLDVDTMYTNRAGGWEDNTINMEVDPK